jgi:hypothetical protein
MRVGSFFLRLESSLMTLTNLVCPGNSKVDDFVVAFESKAIILPLNDHPLRGAADMGGENLLSLNSLSGKAGLTYSREKITRMIL